LLTITPKDEPAFTEYNNLEDLSTSWLGAA